MSMYERYGRTSLTNLERKIAAGRYVTGLELAETLRANSDKQLPEPVLDYVCRFLEGRINKPKGRPKEGSLGLIRRMVAVEYYQRCLTWLQSRKRSCGLEGWAQIREADWWQGPANERAARMTAHRLFPNHTWRHVQNLVSVSK